MISYKYKKDGFNREENMFKQLIAGELVEGDGKPLEVINPTTGKKVLRLFQLQQKNKHKKL